MKRTISIIILLMSFVSNLWRETVELKEVVVDDIKKEIIAFANCDGGKLYIGGRTGRGISVPEQSFWGFFSYPG